MARPYLIHPREDFFIGFDEFTERLLLFQAAVWIGTAGVGADSAAIADGDFLERAATKLLKALADGRIRATGLPPASLVREEIPVECWERARYDPPRPLTVFQGHILDFIERHNGQMPRFGGTLTLAGTGEPRWICIETDLPGLRRLQEAKSKSPLQEARPKPRGRRPSFDWDAFRSAAMEKLDHEGAFNPAMDTKWNLAALERHMATWCRTNWDAEPAESTIRSKLSEIEGDFRKGRESQ